MRRNIHLQSHNNQYNMATNTEGKNTQHERQWRNHYDYLGSEILENNDFFNYRHSIEKAEEYAKIVNHRAVGSILADTLKIIHYNLLVDENVSSEQRRHKFDLAKKHGIKDFPLTADEKICPVMLKKLHICSIDVINQSKLKKREAKKIKDTDQKAKEIANKIIGLEMF